MAEGGRREDDGREGDGGGEMREMREGVRKGEVMCGTVKPLYSGHSVKQPPHYYSYLLQVTCNIMAYI